MNPATITIGPLTASDLSAAMRLKELARWNQTERDWRRLLELEPQGCFAAWRDGELVGTTTTTAYGRELAWIGMVLVDPAQRRRGIARQLMKTALDYLRALPVATIKLDATPAGEPVYEALGFVREEVIERWSAMASAAADAHGEPLRAEAMEELLALDRVAFGADRRVLIASLIADASVAPQLVRSGAGELRGYALARAGAAASYIGPLVATEREAALSLLDAMLAQLNGARVYLDFYPGGQLAASDLMARGFSKERDLIRMSLGAVSGAGASRFVSAIAGPEVG